MIVNMTTIASRQEHYIDRTLESLSRSDGRDIPVNLILGSHDTSHVERYKHVVNIVPWDRDAESRAREGRMRHNCNVNALRALKYGMDDHCLCCEDDILFEKDWLSQLMLTIAEIPGNEYALNLGHRRDQTPGKRYAIHTRPQLCGAQAIFYPTKPFRNRVAEYLEHNITKSTNDHLVGKYTKQHAALYSTNPVLVEHIGAVSCFHPARENPTAAPDRARSGDRCS